MYMYAFMQIYVSIMNYECMYAQLHVCMYESMSCMYMFVHVWVMGKNICKYDM